ncbi:unnamed protein product [Phytomonas sp. EM1]|nr:unnamed protein product [Phytomonas sp. EM1]|eukprot:CCW62024.1 unnamed protein product [Phytomonas sp. isolate EM1]
MENVQRLRIKPEDILEGYGRLEFNDDVPAPSASITSPQDIILDSSMTPTFLPRRKWDRADALRQLKEALLIDTPPRLVMPRVSPGTGAEREDIHTSDKQLDLLCRIVGKIHPSMRASRTLQEIHSECAALMDCLCTIGNGNLDSTMRSDSNMWFVSNEGVDVLQARARRALRKAREWDEVRELLDQDSFQRRFFDANNAERVIGDVIKFRACVAHAKGLTNEFATLLDRLYLIVPVMEGVIGRSRALDDLEETTSLEFSTELDNLLKAMGSFEEIVKQNNTALSRNVDSITERVAHIRQRLSRSSESI